MPRTSVQAVWMRAWDPGKSLNCPPAGTRPAVVSPAEKAENAENADSEADDDTKAVVLTLPGEEHANRSREALLATYQGYRAFVLTARSFGRWGLATFGDGATDP